MTGHDKDSDRQPPTNGWSEWRYYILEKIKDYQEIIERLVKENADLRLDVQLMRENKLEQRHEDLKKKVSDITQAVAKITENVRALRTEHQEKRKTLVAIRLAIAQGFIALVVATGGFILKQCSSNKDADSQRKSPSPIGAASDPSKN